MRLEKLGPDASFEEIEDLLLLLDPPYSHRVQLLSSVALV